MKEKVAKWDIFEVLTNEEEIQAFVEASIDEAKDDTDPAALSHCLAVASEARERLAGKVPAASGLSEKEAYSRDPRVSDFDKTARSFGYHLTLSPLG